MAHVSFWSCINVRNDDHSVSNWSLDKKGRLVNPPKPVRRHFRHYMDGSYQPVSHNPPVSEDNSRWNFSDNSFEPRPSYDAGSNMPEILEEYDVEYPDYIMDDQYLDSQLPFGVW